MKLLIVAAAYALWLLAIEVIFFLIEGNDITALEGAVILGIFPAGLQFFLLGINPYGLAAPVKVALCFVLVVLLSYLGHADSNSFTPLIELIFNFTIAIMVAGSPDTRLLRKIAVLYSVPAAVFLIYADMTGERVWGRLFAGTIQANWWGLMAVVLAVTGFAHKSRLVTAFCIATALYVAYDASSRSSMVAIVGATLALGLARLPNLRVRHLVVAAVGLIGVITVWVLFNPVIEHTLPAALNEVMKFDDPNRGVSTGFTGRSDLWAAAIDAWLRSPLVGVGFHQHQWYTPGYIGAHEAYLAVLADTGILGLLWYLFFIVASLWGSLGIRDGATRSVVLVTIVAYALVGLFEARAINGGNPFSIFFQMCCFFSLAQASLRRAVKSLPHGPVGMPQALDPT